jgi:hypothetical protein
MSQLGMVGEYFAKNFYSQFQIKDEAIVSSPEAVALITQIFQDENNNSENSQFIKEIAIAEGVDGYVNDCDVFLESYKSSDGYIRDIPIYFCYQVTDQRIIDFVKEKQQFIFDELQLPEGKSRHLRKPDSVKVSKIKVSDNRLSVGFEFSFHINEHEDFFIEQLGKNRIRYKLRKDHHGYSFFNVTTTFFQELTE